MQNSAPQIKIIRRKSLLLLPSMARLLAVKKNYSLVKAVVAFVEQRKRDGRSY